MTEVEDSPVLRPDFDPDLYFKTAELAASWMPRLGGYDYKVEEELPRSTAAIVTPKHTSMMDLPLVAATANETYGRYIRFVGKRELFELPVIGSSIADYFYARGAISLDRKVRLNNQPARAEVEQALYEQELVGLFGEGTRRRDRKHERGRKVGKIRKGLAALAMRHNVPIQAVGLAGTRHWYGRKFAVYGRVLMPDQDRFDLEDDRSFMKYAHLLTEDVHSSMQDATNKAHRERDKMKVFIPFFPGRK